MPSRGTDKVTATKQAQRIVRARPNWIPCCYHLKSNRWETWNYRRPKDTCMHCGDDIVLGADGERHMALQFNRAHYWMSSCGRYRQGRRTDAITIRRVHERCWKTLVKGVS